jgi:hypothetical protein
MLAVRDACACTIKACSLGIHMLAYIMITGYCGNSAPSPPGATYVMLHLNMRPALMPSQAVMR